MSDTQLRQQIAAEHPDADLAQPADEPAIDSYLLWPLLLNPLADVKQDPRYHPEGDALHHALQTFENARRQRPYDSELITAALLHDVGKPIDPHDHVAAGLEALDGTLTDREYFLIAHHMDAQALHARKLGHRAARRLRHSEWFDDLMLLRELDDRARQPGAELTSVERALKYLRSLEEQDAP